MREELKRHVNLWNNFFIWVVLLLLGSIAYIICYAFRLTK